MTGSPYIERHNPVGGILVFTTAGYVVTSRASPPQPFKVNDPPYDITIDPPQRTAPIRWRRVPQLTAESFAQLFPALSSPPQLLGTSIIVGFNENGELTLSMDTKEQYEAFGRYACDSIVVKVIGPGDSNNLESKASLLLRETLAWVRILSGQWWAGRSIEHPHHTLSCQLFMPLVSENVLDGSQLAPSQLFFIASRDVKAVTAEIWQQCLNNAMHGQAPPAYEVILSDIKYYFSGAEFLTCIILATSLFELMRNDIFERERTSARQLQLGETALEKHVTVGFDKLLNRNLKREASDAYAFLESCWVARGHVAHGKPFFWKSDREARNPPSDFVSKVQHIYEWFCSVLQEAKGESK